jgi:glucosylglycerate synthase
MAEVESAPEQVQERSDTIEHIGSADLVVGIFAAPDQDTVAMVRQARTGLSGSPRIVILQGGPAAANATVAGNDSSVFVLSRSALGAETLGTGMPSISAAYQLVFAASERLGARACCVIASKTTTPMPQWISHLTQPLLEGECGLVVPDYAHGAFEGLLNAAVVSPLTRSLYGKRIRNPMGPDLGVSRQLFQRMLGADRNGRMGSRMHPLASLAPMALCSNLEVGQVRGGSRVYPPTDWMNVSSLVAQVLGPVFLEVERNAGCWQRIRGSVPVREFGDLAPVTEDAGTVDISRMAESFQLGIRDLREIWSLVLPPTTLLELTKLSRLAPDRFQMRDELWVRIVYDFALGHRLRTINRDHLLGSFTPLYLGWVASFVRELETAGAAAREQRLERLALAYEAAKPYLVSRWRWPDRFSP